MGPNSFVVGIHHVDAPVVHLRSSWLDLTSRMLLVLLSIALYQRPGTASPCAQTPEPKNGRKNSSAITRSLPSQSGCDALQRAGPRVAVEAGVEAELPAELIADVGEDGVLAGVEHGPERHRVDQLPGAEPALEEDHHPVRVDVVAAIDRARVPEVIDEAPARRASG